MIDNETLDEWERLKINDTGDCGRGVEGGIISQLIQALREERADTTIPEGRKA